MTLESGKEVREIIRKMHLLDANGNPIVTLEVKA